MKKDKGFEDDRASFSWEDIVKEKESWEGSDKKEKEKYEWDRPLVDENWTIDNTGEMPSAGPTDSKTGIRPGSVTALLPPEDAIYKAMLDEDIDLSAQLSQSLNKVMDNTGVDERAIKSKVDQKIVIQSEELKKKRGKKDAAPRKVRRRIPKNPDSPYEKDAPEKLSASERRKQKYVHAELEQKPEMSDFRRKSMNWRDDGEQNPGGVGGEAADFMDATDGLFAHFGKYTGLQWLALALAIIIVLTAAMTTGVYASYRGEQNKARALKNLQAYSEESNNADTEAYVEEEMTEASAEPEEVVEIKTLSLMLTSVEKDLKIKLVDQDDTLVKGLAWGVIVTDADGKISDNDDEDRDGIIYLTEISAGDYSVELKPSSDLADYILPQSAQMVSVKAKVEYKVIANIKDEIKSEKEVNAAVEDNGNKAADVETGKLTDTVEWVESTKTAGGESYVESAVYLEYTATADKVKNYFAMALDKLGEKISRKGTSVIGMPLLVAAEDTGDASLTSDTGENGDNNDDNTDPGEQPAPTQPDPVIGNNVTFGSESISVGETTSATITVENVTDCHVDWSSSDTSVATVSGNGTSATVTAVKEGTSTIVANVTGANGSGMASGTITVTAKKVSEIKLNPTTLALVVGNAASITATPSTPGVALNWSSSDITVATVDSNGKVTAVKAGNAVITVEAGDGSGVKATCQVTVTDSEVKVKKITITPTEASVAVKGNYQLAISFDPAKPTNSKVTWKSADTSIATVSDGGLVTGVKEGTTKITVEATDGSGVKAECTVKVTAEVLYADTAQLYDKDRNPLYKQDGSSYTLAKYKDYKANPSIKLFKKTDGYLYTGWQTIDGKTYYYKRDNTPVTGDQVIGGVTYHFATDGSLTQGSGTLGIDVSKYQPSINWSSVKNSGVNFVIIRCGYRGSSTGVLIQDPYFTSHIKGAKAAGLKVGVYFFTTALTEAEAIEEASMCAYLCSGYGINYPVFMDCESSNRPGYNSLSAGQRTQIIQAFCNTLKSAGYTPGVYANKTWLTEKMNASALSGYKIWLAQYNAAGPTYTGRYDLWQYTSKGSVSGISGNVDMNQSYLGY